MIHTLHIGLSYKCNLKCKHCFVNVSGDEMSVDKCLNTIDSLISEGLFFVIYTYGEPLLWPEFFDMVEQVKTRGVVQVLMTNGTLIDERMAKKIKSSGIDKVYVSIDSANEYKHDLNRGMKGAFRKAIYALELLRGISVKTGIATTVTKDNCNELEDIYEIMNKYDLDEISFLRERCEGKIVEFSDESYVLFFRNHINEIGRKITFHDSKLNKVVFEEYSKGTISDSKKDLLLDMNQCKNNYTLCIYPNGEMSKCNFCKKLNSTCFEVDFVKYIRSCEFKNEDSICCS